jgi:hypothetical protein
VSFVSGADRRIVAISSAFAHGVTRPQPRATYSWLARGSGVIRLVRGFKEATHAGNVPFHASSSWLRRTVQGYEIGIEASLDIARRRERLKWIATARIVTTRYGKSDNLIPARPESALVQAVAPFQSLPDDENGWHPGSRGQVLDLVHPSLYPLVHGRSVVRSGTPR